MTKKNEIPLVILRVICDPDRVNSAHYQGYMQHLGRGLSRASFVECSHHAIELAAQLYPDRFPPRDIMRAFRTGQHHLELYAHRFLMGQLKSFKASYYNYLMKHRYGMGANGHLDAPFSDLPEALLTHYGLKKVVKDPEEIERMGSAAGTNINEGKAADEAVADPAEVREESSEQTETIYASELIPETEVAAPACEEAAVEEGISKIRKPESVGYNPVPRNIRRQLARDAKKLQSVASRKIAA